MIPIPARYRMFRKAGADRCLARWLAIVCTEVAVEGRASTQIPHYCYWIGPAPVPPTKNYLEHLALEKHIQDIMDEGFPRGYCVWLTNKGVISTKGCINPVTKRHLNGGLYISPALVNAYFEVFYRMYVLLGQLRGVKHIRQFNKQIYDT